MRTKSLGLTKYSNARFVSSLICFELKYQHWPFVDGKFCIRVCLFWNRSFWITLFTWHEGWSMDVNFWIIREPRHWAVSLLKRNLYSLDSDYNAKTEKLAFQLSDLILNLHQKLGLYLRTSFILETNTIIKWQNLNWRGSKTRTMKFLFYSFISTRRPFCPRFNET